jgi:hypothetical protein
MLFPGGLQLRSVWGLSRSFEQASAEGKIAETARARLSDNARETAKY